MSPDLQALYLLFRPTAVCCNFSPTTPYLVRNQNLEGRGHLAIEMLLRPMTAVWSAEYWYDLGKDCEYVTKHIPVVLRTDTILPF